MQFEQDLFKEYKRITETTNLQKCYQQILKLIRYISSKLEKEMPEYMFMGRVVENQMDFSYFQATTKSLKEAGLKIQVVFMHRTCEFEIWISGYSRKIQCSYYERLRYTECPFEMCATPERNDFIIKTVARKKITTDAPEVIIAEIKRKIVELEEYIKKYQRLETTER